MVILYGARTGGDGIGGVSRPGLGDVHRRAGPTKRPASRSATRSWRSCSSSARSRCCGAGWSRASRTWAAAGISCATSELASNGEGGMHVVAGPRAAARPHALARGDPHERVAGADVRGRRRPADVDAFLAICAKWDVEAAVIGEVNDSGRLTSTGTASGSSTCRRAPSRTRVRSTTGRSPGRSGWTRCRTTRRRPSGWPGRRAPASSGRPLLTLLASPEPRGQGLGHRPVRPLRAGQHRPGAARGRGDDPRRRADRPRRRAGDRLQRPVRRAGPVRGRPAGVRRGVPERGRRRARSRWRSPTA